MTKHTISFSLDIHLGDSTIQEAVSGSIEVNLYDDPKDDEINSWGESASWLPYKTQDKMERLAIDEARRQLAKDLGERAINAEEEA